MQKKVNTIIFDLRLLQTGAWYRGMGRYTAALLGELPGVIPKGTRLVGLFGTDLPYAKERADEVRKISPGIETVVLKFKKGSSIPAERYNAAATSAWVKQNVVGEVNFIAASIFSFDFQPFLLHGARNSVIFYDLIPYKNWDIFANHFPLEEYFKRFSYIYSADHLFAISGAVRQDLIGLLGVNSGRITNIMGAAIPAALLDDTNEQDDTALLDQLAGQRYVLLPGGASPHKNMYRAVAAFDIFNKNFGDTFKLVISSNYPEHMRRNLQNISPNILLSGEVSSDTLAKMYGDAEAVMFPSLDEGLGLPILEAAMHGKPVVCSDIPVFREFSDDFYFFDPKSLDSIARGLLQAVVDASAGINYADKYRGINDKFSWHQTSRSFVEGLTGFPSRELSRDHHDILIEFDTEYGDIKQIGQVLEQHELGAVTLWADTYIEKNRPRHELPLVQRHFLRSNDIVSYVASKGSPVESRSVIFTGKSLYTAYFALKYASSIICSKSDMRHAIKRFLGFAGAQQASEHEIDALTKLVSPEISNVGTKGE